MQTQQIISPEIIDEIISLMSGWRVECDMRIKEIQQVLGTQNLEAQNEIKIN